MPKSKPETSKGKKVTISVEQLSQELEALKLPPPKLYYTRLYPDAYKPYRATPRSVGLDLRAPQTYLIQPNQRLAIPLGIAVSIPTNHYGRLAPTSGLALSFGIDVLGGVIDPDYRGELVTVLINHGDQEVTLHKGRKLVQLILEKAAFVPAVEVAALDPTSRGACGFGSTTSL